VVLLLPLLAGLAACGDDATTTDVADQATASTGPGAPRGDITVFAAASLSDAFGEVGTAFEEANPGTTVTFNFGASSALATQIGEGAPADVFAPADTTQMDEVVESGATGQRPQPFATNVLQIAVPAGNPGGVTGLADFAEDDLLIGLCAEEVPCGRFGRQVLTQAAVTPAVDTDETDVRALLTKLEAGELDAGIVYRTDVLAADGSVEGVDIPADQNVVASYPIAALGESEAPGVARAFVDFVLSADGLELLQRFGFRAP
jgi:molybdate transport system substrate-binding protein